MGNDENVAVIPVWATMHTFVYTHLVAMPGSCSTGDC